MSILPQLLQEESNRRLEKSIDKPELYLVPKELNIQKRKPIQAFVKRLIDLTFCLSGFILILPVLILIAIIIKIDSQGPVIFKQKRIGLNGKIFNMYKFRTMFDGADLQEEEIRAKFTPDNVVMFKLKEDYRVTKIGKVLRKYSLDEFPQLINVIKGEMSLVGPRPRVIKDLQYFNKWHYTFFAATPGITGLWQTSGRSSIKDFNTVVALENYYIKNWNLGFDFILLLKTIPVVLSGKNTA